MFAPLWEIKLLRTGKYGEERREKRPNRGGTPGEKAETGRKSGRKATPGGTPSVEAATGRNAGRSDQNGEKRREKRTTGRDRGEQGLDSEKRGGGGDKTSKMTFSPPLSQLFLCGGAMRP